jgi:DegV family protein with EDD domain
MEKTIRVVTDSSCDLPPELAQELEIEIVPLTVIFGTESYTDGELSLEQFWTRAAGPLRPKTSQPSVGAFAEVFGRLVSEGSQVLCVMLTGKHSGTFNTAHLAAQSFAGAVTVFDSQSLSLGLGLQAMAAAQAARTASSMQEILTELKQIQARMRLVILLDTLENLRLGGRADGFMAVAERMTQALNIKVIINLVEGQLRLLGAARSFKSGLSRARGFIEQLGPLEHLAVVHTRRQPMADKTADQLAQRTGFPREHIWIRETGPVLATHGGPGLIGILAVPIPPQG